MEQAFKFSQEQAETLEAVKQLMNPDFIAGVQERFNEMYLSMKGLLSANG